MSKLLGQVSIENITYSSLFPKTDGTLSSFSAYRQHSSGINYLLCAHLMIMSLQRTPKAMLCTGPLLFCFPEANVLCEAVI